MALPYTIQRLRAILRSRILIDYNRDHRATVLVAGSGRSGTTWVSDIINYRNQYRYMFEPFYPARVPVCRPFRYKQYLRPENREQRFIEPARLILSGGIRNPWVDAYNRRLLCNRRLIKDIRANLLLKWMHVNFPDIPIILFFRHPCAVARSRLKLNWQTFLHEFLEQKELMEDFLEPFKAAILKADTAFEEQIFLWCIEYYVPLRQFSRHEIHLAFYETLCECPEIELERLALFLRESFDPASLAHLQAPSAMSRADSAIMTGGNLIDSWRDTITDTQVRRAVEILGLFGLDAIYSDQSMPNVKNAYEMLSPNSG